MQRPKQLVDARGPQGLALRVVGIQRKEIRSRSIEGLRDSAHRHKRGRTVVQTQREQQGLTKPLKSCPCVRPSGSFATASCCVSCHLTNAPIQSSSVARGSRLCPWPALRMPGISHEVLPAVVPSIRSFGVVVLLDLENDLRNRTKPQVVSAMSNSQPQK